MDHRSLTAGGLAFLRHQEKVSAHAERRLAPAKNQLEPAAIAKELRAFARLEEERLRVTDRMGASGLWTARARSFAIDLLVRRVFEQSSAALNAPGNLSTNRGLAVVALGGYGRSELAPFSDLDLLFLSTDRATGTLGALLTGVFATRLVNPIFRDAPVGLLDGSGRQMLNQLVGILIAIIIAAVGSLIILKFVDLFIGARVTAEEEITGLDVTQHGEEGYELVG